MPKSRLIELGYVIEAHGMQGGLKIALYNQQSSAFAEGLPVFLRKSAGEVGETDAPAKVESVKAQSFGVVANISSVADRTAAEGAKGLKIYVARDSLPPLAQGEFYLCDLIGFAAVKPNGCALGVVVDFTDNGAQALFIVQTEKGLRFLVPNVPQIIIEVNMETRTIIMNPPAGLFEDETLAF